MEFQDISLINGYHAHVYFDESTLQQATVLCEEAGKQFSVQVGRVHRKKVGLILVGVVDSLSIKINMPI